MEDLINEQILENIFEEIQENYPNLSEQDQQPFKALQMLWQINGEV